MLTSEQVLFAEAVARFADQEYGKGMSWLNRQFDRSRLRRLGELGCLSLAIPAEHGGLGGPVEAMIALEKLAPALAMEPVIASSIHAASLITAAASPERAAHLLPAIASGDLVVGVAQFEERARYDLQFVETRLVPNGAGMFLHGSKPLVAWAGEADLFVVSARRATANELTLILVDPRSPGVTVVPRQRLDGIPCGDVRFDACAIDGSACLDAVPAAQALSVATDRAEAAQVAEMVGLMDALIAATIDYVRTRRQFGAAIGTFQAIQHRIADMWIACEEARSLTFAAALACDKSSGERREAVSLAKIRACDAARLVGNEAIQLHGGIGMTDELIVSHWYKRLWALMANLGDRRYHLGRLAAARRPGDESPVEIAPVR